jgi:hypothetical protein
MSQSAQFDEGPAPSQPVSQAGSPIRDDCRAAPIGEVTAFAECLTKTGAACPHRMAFNAWLYCLHPQRELIIARTLAREEPRGT